MFKSTETPPLPAQDHVRVIEDKLQPSLLAQSSLTDVQNSWVSSFRCEGRPSRDAAFPLNHPSGFPLVRARLLILLVPGGRLLPVLARPQPQVSVWAPRQGCCAQAWALLGWNSGEQDTRCPLSLCTWWFTQKPEVHLRAQGFSTAPTTL